MRRAAIPEGGFRHIAVLRLSSLGDVILTLPVVHALARAYREARITYWTKEEYRDLVCFDPAVAHVRALERDARGVEDLLSMSAELEDADLIVDLHGSMRTHLLTFRQRAPVLRAPSFRARRAALVHARALRPRRPPTALERNALALAPLRLAVPGVPRVAVPAEAEAWAEGWLAQWAGGASPVALLPGARHFTKRWPEAHWVLLAEALAAAGRPLVCLSLAAERDASPLLAAAIERLPRARWCLEPLPRMGALLSRCLAAVTCDSGLMHLAAARGTRVVAIFGSTVPELGFGPAGEGHVVLCRHEPCQPCTLHGRASCPQVHFRCLTGIAPETVQAALSDSSFAARLEAARM